MRSHIISTTLQKVGFFPTLVYIYLWAIKGLFGLFVADFMVVKGLFGLFVAGSIVVKGLFELCLAAFMAVLRPIYGWFCGLICDCLWHVQRVVLRTVWIKKNLDCL